MSDRLAELVRQRALVAEHLAWLDRQVAEAAQTSLTPPTQVVASSPSPTAPTVVAVTAADPGSTITSGSRSPLESEDILAQYRVPPSALREDVRKGCFLYFIGAFVALGLGLLLLYFILRPR